MQRRNFRTALMALPLCGVQGLASSAMQNLLQSFKPSARIPVLQLRMDYSHPLE